MRTLILLMLTTISLGSTAQSMKDFKWLDGNWERQKLAPGKTAFENWSYSNKGLSGLGATLVNGDTVFTENLQIVRENDAFYYVAKPSQNDSATKFKVTAVTKTGFVCENPAHDFPKKIEYRMEGEFLIATISDSEKAIPFTFKKRE